jgi:hypothetical protein
VSIYLLALTFATLIGDPVAGESLKSDEEIIAALDTEFQAAV